MVEGISVLDLFQLGLYVVVGIAVVALAAGLMGIVTAALARHATPHPG